MKSDVVDLETTLRAEMQADRAQRDSLLDEIRELRLVLLDSLGVQGRRDISGRVDLQRQIEDLNTTLAQLIQLTGETQRQLSRLEEAGWGGGSAGEAAIGAAAGAVAAGAVQAGDGEQGGDQAEALYTAALQQLRRQSYGTARVGFQEFLERYPNHELAPDAQYYMAETYAESGEPDQALDEYARVLELYPNSRRAPTALYKSGLIEQQRGNLDDARTFFSRVTQGYPDSDEVELARRELDRLGG
jgi:tol-pal system protein YbgF